MTFTVMSMRGLNNITVVVSPHNKVKINEKEGYRVVKEIMVSDKIGKQYLKSLSQKPINPPKEISDIVEELLRKM